MKNNDNPVIGYSAFMLFEECYEYNENACYIADSPDSLKKVFTGARFNINNYRIDTIRLNDIIDDYGCSCGEFAMEPEALKRFEQIPGIKYTVTPFDDAFSNGEPDLFVINIEKINNNNLTIEEVLESFHTFDGIYKRKQIDAAINMKDEIIPHLIKILENAHTNYEKYIFDPDRYDYIYALMLLAQFKEPKSHKIIVELFSLPGDIPDKLFGEITISNLPVILLNTCGGSVDLIKSLILNKEAYDYCRVSACQALAYAVIKEYVSRKTVLELFATLFTGEETDGTSDFWGLLADYVCDLYPEEIMDVIKQAYEDGLIMPGLTHYDSFEEALELGKDGCLNRLKKNFERNRFDDIHDMMSWWACFNEKSATPSTSFDMQNDFFPDYSTPSLKKPKKGKKKTRKKKRKQAKASRKKNRR